jgi:hypothetical protein
MRRMFEDNREKLRQDIARMRRKMLVEWPPRYRIPTGIGLVIGGLLGFLPILGFWMLPLGLVVLSADYAPLRRRRRRIVVWWERRRRRPRADDRAPRTP